MIASSRPYRLSLCLALLGAAGCSDSVAMNLEDLSSEWRHRIEVAGLGLGSKANVIIAAAGRTRGQPYAAGTVHHTIVLGDRLGSTGPDADKDGISDADEMRIGTDPQNADRDGDGIPDPFELFAYRSSPKRTDSDGDGSGDGAEIDMDSVDPGKDSDGDGIPDVAESAAWGSDPTSADSDGDKIPDSDEFALAPASSWPSRAWATVRSLFVSTAHATQAGRVTQRGEVEM